MPIPNLRRVFRLPRRGVDDDVDRELRFHIDSRIDELLAGGMTRDEARATAIREFGDVDDVRRVLLHMDSEQFQRTRRAEVLDELRQDAGFAFRALRTRPGFAVTAILTLALGIGATTAMFSVVSAVLLDALPFEQPERLVRIWSAEPERGNPQAAVSIPDFADWRSQNTVFESVSGYSTLASGVILTGRGEPVRLHTAWVTEDFFRTLGLRMRLGRPIRPDEHAPGANQVVVLSHRIWRERFGGEPDIVGRTIQLNDAPFTVAGVADASARFPSDEVEAWVPLSLVPETSIPRFRFVRWINVVARLDRGVPIERAQREMDVIAGRLAAEHPDANASFSSATVRPLRDHLVGDVRGALLVLFGAVMLVLLISVVNVASLMLARATTREREIAVRAALGAGRGRIIRQLLTESTILAFIAGALGIAVAFLGMRALMALGGSWVPDAANVRVDAEVLGFALGVSLIAGIGFGIIPALRSASPDLARSLREGGRSGAEGGAGHRLRTILVAAEVALAVTLVIGAGLVTRSFARLTSVDPGFAAENVLVARFTIPNTRYPDRARYLSLYDRILEQVRGVPDVVSAAAIKDIPFRGTGEIVPYRVIDRPDPRQGEEPRARVLPVSDGYFATMRIPLIAGRDFTAADTAPPNARIIISESLARRWWPDGSALDRELAFLGGAPPLRVIGVAGDVRSDALDADPPQTLYVPVRVMPRVVVSLAARTTGEPARLAAAVRDAIHAVDPHLPIDELTPMRTIVAGTATAQRFLATLLGIFAAIAIVLAAIGLYGLVSHAVTQRTREIGVRMALGARRESVVRLILWRGMAPVLAGLVGGVATALALRQVLAGLLYDISPADPTTYAAVAAVLALVGLAAAWIPARRAARVEPVIALREG